MSVDALIAGIASKFEGDEGDLRAIIMKALKDAKFLEATTTVPAITEKTGAKSSGQPTTYTQFLRHWNVQLKTQYPDFTARQQIYIQMWKALSVAEKKSWKANGDQPSQVVARHQTGYQLFVHENKNCVEVMACKPGADRFKKLGAMWQALKNVPVKGQTYWNERAKGVEVVTPQAPVEPKVVVAPAKVEVEEEEESEVDEADESEEDE
jgi:hypothetical protein